MNTCYKQPPEEMQCNKKYAKNCEQYYKQNTTK